MTGTKHGVSSRMCIDIARSYLHASKPTPFEKGCVKVACCDGAWPRAVAHERGLLSDPVSELCGISSDTAMHRLWRCCAVDEIRCKAVKREVPDVVRGDPAASEILAATRGFFPHPAEGRPHPPAALDLAGLDITSRT